MAFSGLRPQVLGNYDGSDGLRLSDLLEAKIDNEKKLIEFTQIPTLIRVRSLKQSWTSIFYFFMRGRLPIH